MGSLDGVLDYFVDKFHYEENLTQLQFEWTPGHMFPEVVGITDVSVDDYRLLNEIACSQGQPPSAVEHRSSGRTGTGCEPNAQPFRGRACESRS